jgi:thiosulfate/3-mercaptopyruvate sulfurtransferase
MTSRPILPTPLMSTDWLANHLGDPDLRVLDATAHLAGPESDSTVGWSLRPGLDDYLAAHIPGAAFADIIEDLSEPGTICLAQLTSFSSSPFVSLPSSSPAL